LGFKIKTGVLAVAMAMSQFAQAEQNLILDEIVVNASSISDSAVDKNTLAHKRTGTSDTAKLLEDQPGVSLYGAGGVSSLPVIHGMADDRVRVQVDGMDLVSSCPNHMNSPLSYIDPSNVSRVKVYAGITPVSAGGDSIGGTIQVDSKKPQFATDGKILFKGEAGAFYRSNGDANGENFTATIANESLSMSYAGSAAMSANYQAGNNFKATTAASTDKLSNVIPGDVVASSAYKSQNHSLDFAYQNMKQLVQLKFGIQDIPYELYPNQRMDMLGNKSQQTKLSYTDEFGWGSLEGSAWYENVDHYMDFGQDKQFTYGSAAKTATSTSTIVATGMPMYTKGVTDGLKLKGEIPLSDKQSLRVGAETQNYRLNDWWPSSPASLTGMESRMSTTSMWMPATVGGMAPNTFLNINNGKRDRLALFTEVESKLNTHWNSLLGVRVEQVTTDADNVQGYNNAMAGYGTSAAAFNARSRSKTDNNIDLTALAQYIPNETNTLELGLAQKTRSPNLYERYSWSQNSMALIMNNFVGDGNGYLGNIDLKPEVARTLSATYDTHDASNDSTWGVKITPYYTHVTDYIDAVRCTGSGTGMNALCGGAATNPPAFMVRIFPAIPCWEKRSDGVIFLLPVY
jgi:iron complex outermembrane recepter protein